MSFSAILRGLKSKDDFTSDLQAKYKAAVNETWLRQMPKGVTMRISKLEEIANPGGRRRLLAVDLKVTTVINGLIKANATALQASLDTEKANDASNKTTLFATRVKQELGIAGVRVDSVTAPEAEGGVAPTAGLPYAPVSSGDSLYIGLAVGGGILIGLIIGLLLKRHKNQEGNQNFMKKLRNDQIDMLARGPSDMIEMDARADPSKPADSYSIEIDEIEVEEY